MIEFRKGMERNNSKSYGQARIVLILGNLYPLKYQIPTFIFLMRQISRGVHIKLQRAYLF